MSPTLRRFLAGLCLGCLALTLFSIALGDGGQKIPWDVPDSQGRSFSFNRPMSGEHILIAMRQVSVHGLLREAGGYGMLLVAMQLAGAVGLICAEKLTGKLVRTFFALQLVLFPFGWLAILGIPWAFFEGIDGETLSDGPPFWWWSQGLWIPVSGIIGGVLRPKLKSSRRDLMPSAQSS